MGFCGQWNLRDVILYLNLLQSKTEREKEMIKISGYFISERYQVNCQSNCQHKCT